MRPLLFSLLAAFALGACSTVPTFPEPDARWRTHAGQLQVSSGEKRVTGEFAVSRLDGDFRMEFSKGGAVPLLRVARHGEFARAEGPLARGRWQGRAARAPKPLQGWVSEVPEAFGRIDAVLAAARAAARSSRGADPGGPARMEVRGASADEKFIFVFSR
jgi:hypothetical protein